MSKHEVTNNVEKRSRTHDYYVRLPDPFVGERQVYTDLREHLKRAEKLLRIYLSFHKKHDEAMRVRCVINDVKAFENQIASYLGD